MIKHKKFLTASTSALLGCIIFAMIYGLNIINLTNVDWIMNAGGDFAQSYFGWRFFRISPLHWPIGLMDGIAYPGLTPIIFVDSIPLFDIIFKVLSKILFLPDKIQFFGIWGMTCFALSGLVGSSLIYKFTQNSAYSLIGSFFFIINNIIIQRLFTHTALAANWLILLCLYLIIAKKDQPFLKKQIPIWSVLFFLCVSIHIYYVAILGILMTMYVLYLYVKYKNIKLSVSIFLCCVLAASATFYMYGGFYQLNSGDASADGLGFYSANLNSLLNPMNTGKYLSGSSMFTKTLPMATSGQYEGYAYLGLGVLCILFIIAISCFNRGFIRKFQKTYIVYKKEIVFILLSCFLLFLAALSPEVTWNDKLLFRIPYPNAFLKLYSIFRSTGRFLWGVWDIIVLSAVFLLWKRFKPRRALCLLILCISLQACDFAGMIIDRHERFAMQTQNYHSSLQDPLWDTVLQDKKQFILFNSQLLRLQTYFDLADKALDYGMEINDFYYARKPLKDIEAFMGKKYEDILQGKADSYDVYIIDTFETADNLAVYLNLYYLDGLLVGLKDKVKSESEIQGIKPCSVDIKTDEYKYLVSLDPGIYGIEIRGDQAVSTILEVDGKELSNVYDKYDGGKLGMAVFEIYKGGGNVTIQNPASLPDIKLFQLDMNYK